MAKEYDEMTVTELKQVIREMIDEMNERVEDYEYLKDLGEIDENEFFNELYKEFIDNETLKEYKGKIIYGFSSRHGKGKRTYKNKSQLKEEAEAIDRFLKKDRYTPLGFKSFKARIESGYYQAYETFKENYRVDENYPDFSKEDFSKLVDTFEDVKNELETYSMYRDINESLVDMYLEEDTIGREKFGNLLSQAVKNITKDRTKVLNGKAVIDELRTML